MWLTNDDKLMDRPGTSKLAFDWPLAATDSRFLLRKTCVDDLIDPSFNNNVFCY